ncbi:hypothetical protein [Tropicimonas sp. S265A]|uniref:hypothetical protein n=1 Tax=Tropicimonas sp. S265A TaxID=3415134 RepID=UPI003C7D3798
MADSNFSPARIIQLASLFSAAFVSALAVYLIVTQDQRSEDQVLAARAFVLEQADGLDIVLTRSRVYIDCLCGTTQCDAELASLKNGIDEAREQSISSSIQSYQLFGSDKFWQERQKMISTLEDELFEPRLHGNQLLQSQCANLRDVLDNFESSAFALAASFSP